MVTGKCSACGCIGVHACIGKQVPMTKVGDAILVNGIADFVRAYCSHSKSIDTSSSASEMDSRIARYTST